MIQIAHEAPLEIMEEVRSNTDYDYALVHLFEEHPDYLEFFKKSLKLDRKVILDNSMYELGESFDSKKYARWIEELRPTEYIIPDAFNNSKKTVESAEIWMNKYPKLPGKTIGVVHGDTPVSFLNCYNSLLALGVDKIAFTFRGPVYEKMSNFNEVELSNDRLRLMSWCLGRIRTLEFLLRIGAINKEKPHHLLGCSLPQEFLHYRGRKFDWIETLDTSNPVTLGLNYHRYDEKGGCSYKPDIKLFERLTEKTEKLQRDIIYQNIGAFKTLVNK